MIFTTPPQPYAHTRTVAGLLAFISTVVCIGMASSAVMERATTTIEQLVMLATAVALVLGSHLLPALSRRSVMSKVLFVVCIVATVYNQAHFFVKASHRAGEQRAKAVTMTGHSLALQKELDSITARPLAKVAADLAKATAQDAATQSALARCQLKTPDKCTTAQVLGVATAVKVQALQVENTQANHAADLRRQLVDAAAAHDAAQALQAANPVDAQLAAITGLSTNNIGTVAAVLQSLLLELLGASLWTVALSTTAAAATTPMRKKETPPAAQTSDVQPEHRSGTHPPQIRLQVVPSIKKNTKKSTKRMPVFV